ncbi:MAG: trehalase-like domain-containing protein, partial [Acidimicrobiales bacterium]
MPDTELAVSRSPSISAHRLLSNGCSSALVRPDGEIDWWCAPRFDSSPLLWKLLDPAGGCARWRGVRMVQASGPPAGPTVTTLLATDDGARVELMDGIVGDEHAAVLVRLVRAELPVVLEHDLTLGGFDLPAVAWTDAGEGRAGDLLVRAEGGELTVEGDRLRSTVTASTRWTGIAVRVGAAPGSIPSFAELAEDLLERERQH